MKSLLRIPSPKALGLETDEYRKVVRKHYDGPAGACLKVGSIISLHEPLVGSLIRTTFSIADCKRILDTGTGAGQILRHILKYAAVDAKICCVDISQAMLLRARARTRSARPMAVASDITRLPFEDNAFDCITCGWVLEHLQDPRPGLAELSRVLQPGGRMLIAATENTMLGNLCSYLWSCRTYNRDELRKICESIGLGWRRQFWFTPVHRALRMGGILVEAVKD